jgi:signal transduction histidine kinase
VGFKVSKGNVLVISDDGEFARSVVARWQAEREVPAFTLMSGELLNGAAAAAYDVAIVGALRSRRYQDLLTRLSATAVCLCVVENESQAKDLADFTPRPMVLRQHDGWPDSVILLACEILKRLEVSARSRRAEESAALSERNATLGRYMLEMRHGLNNALTSVIGNSELLLLEPSGLSMDARDQIDTIHTSALKIHEILQRFSSLEHEMRFLEKVSHGETHVRSRAHVAGD